MATGRLVPKGGKIIGSGKFSNKKKEVPNNKKRSHRYASTNIKRLLG